MPFLKFPIFQKQSGWNPTRNRNLMIGVSTHLNPSPVGIRLPLSKHCGDAPVENSTTPFQLPYGCIFHRFSYFGECWGKCFFSEEQALKNHSLSFARGVWNCFSSLPYTMHDSPGDSGYYFRFVRIPWNVPARSQFFRVIHYFSDEDFEETRMKRLCRFISTIRK